MRRGVCELLGRNVGYAAHELIQSHFCAHDGPRGLEDGRVLDILQVGLKLQILRPKLFICIVCGCDLFNVCGCCGQCAADLDAFLLHLGQSRFHVRYLGFQMANGAGQRQVVGRHRPSQLHFQHCARRAQARCERIDVDG